RLSSKRDRKGSVGATSNSAHSRRALPKSGGGRGEAGARCAQISRAAWHLRKPASKNFAKQPHAKCGLLAEIRTINRSSNHLIFGVASNPILRRSTRELATGGRLETHRCQEERRNSTIKKRRQFIR